MNKATDIGDELKRCGLKATKRRAFILGILKKSPQPMSAEQVFLKLKAKDMPANLSTVYRTLEVLTDKELVLKLNVAGDNRTLYEYNSMIHRHYLVCLGCREIKAIESCPLEDYEESIAKETRYSITGHKLNIYGYCPVCASKGITEE